MNTFSKLPHCVGVPLLAGMLVALTSVIGSSSRGYAADVTPPPAGLAASDELATYAALGSAVAQKMRIAELDWTEARFSAFVSGLRAGAARQSYPFNDAAQHLFDEINRRAAEERTRSKGTSTDPLEQFMRQAREQIGMVQSEDGLLCRIAVAGSGPRPRLDSTIVINLSAKAPDGVTDLPTLGGQNLRVKVKDLLPGLAEGVQMLALGARAIFVVPPKLSFGDGEWPSGVGRGIPILFMVELEDIVPSTP